MATRRIGFDFARPLSASAIWWGRLAGAMLLGAGAALVLWVPSSMAGARPPWNDLWTAPEPPAAWPLLALGGFAVLFAIAHCASLALRSRSGLLALDAALATLCGYLVWAAFSRLPVYRAEAPSLRLAVGLAVAAGAACLAAGYASVVRGRTDARTGHRALSAVLWTVIGAAVLCANAYAAWVHGAKPEDLREGFWVNSAAAGPWLTVSGPARGAEATFVYDAAGGRSERTFTPDWRGPVLSRDGRRAAWVEAASAWSVPGLDLAPRRRRRKARPDADSSRELSVPLRPLHGRDAPGELGRRDSDRLRSRTAAGPRVGPDPLGRSPEPGRNVFQPRRLSRLPRGRPFDRPSPAGRARAIARDARPDRNRRRPALLPGGCERATGFSRSAAGASTSASSPRTVPRSRRSPTRRPKVRWPAFLPDGRIVLSERSSGNRRLRVFGSDGREGAAVPLPPASSVSLGGEVAPGVLCLGVADAASRPSAWLADLNAGTVRKVADDLRPVTTRGRSRTSAARRRNCSTAPATNRSSDSTP